MTQSDIDYFRQRALEERERATTASSPIIAQIHLSLALSYETLIKQLNGTTTLGIFSKEDKPSSSPEGSAPSTTQ